MHHGETEDCQFLRNIGQHALPFSALHVPMQLQHHEFYAHNK